MQNYFSLLIVALFLQEATASAADYYDMPAASAVSSGVGSLTAFVENLGELSDKPQLVTFVDKQLGKLPGLQFIDRKRPLGAFLYFPKQGIKPTVLIAIPVTDFPGLKEFATTKLKVPVSETEQPDRWKVTGKKKEFYVQLFSGTVFISERGEVLDQHCEFTQQLMRKQSAHNDLSITLQPQVIPKELRDAVISKIKDEMERDVEHTAKEGSAERQLHKRVADLVATGLTHVIQETETVTLGVRLTPTLQTTMNWQAFPESKLAKTLREFAPQTNRFEVSSSAAASAQISIQFPQPVRELFLTIAKLVRAEATQKIGEKLAPDDRHPVSQVFKTLNATIKQGTLNTTLQFRPVNNKFALLTMIELQEEEGLATSLRAILPYVEKDEKVRVLQLDAIRTDTSSVHYLSNKETSREDRDIYGEEVGLYVGTSPLTGWFAVGGPETTRLIKSELNSRANARVDQDESASLLNIHWSFRPWIELAVRNESKDEMLQILQQAFPSHEQDAIHLNLRCHDSGLQANLLVEECYHTAAGIVLGEILQRRDEKISE